MEPGSRALRFTRTEHSLIALCFLICFAGALLLPWEQCPDEAFRYRLIEWMVKHGTLPPADDPELLGLSDLVKETYGFSYALRPYLPAMIGALFTKAALFFTDSKTVLLLASRLCSVLSVTGCCFFCLKTGHRLFEKRSSAILFAAVVCFQPQVLFLGMYHNNDAPSLFAVSMMLYFLADGYSREWPAGSCAGLAFAFSAGLLTYYTVFGWILMSTAFCIAAVLIDPGIRDKGRLIAKRAALIAGICLLLSGWFYIRNALVLNGDFLGIAYEEVSRARVKEMGYPLYEYVNAKRDGLTALQFLRSKNYEWVWMSARSFIGVFGGMTIYLPAVRYGVYYTLHALGALLFLSVLIRQKPSRRDALWTILMLSSSLITLALHFRQCYARDYQPQGRYVITLVLAFAWMTAYGLDRTGLSVRGNGGEKERDLHPAAAYAVLWILLFFVSFYDTMSKMIV